MVYRVEFVPRAKKELDALDRQVRVRIIKALAKLAVEPHRASNVKALQGGGFRLRIGDYRVLYTIEDSALLVLIIKVAHRREVYRD
jgi:mRNA interferase RelE/StbE